MERVRSDDEGGNGECKREYAFPHSGVPGRPHTTDL